MTSCKHFIVATLVACFLFPYTSGAQLGWRWATGSSTTTPGGEGFDALASAIDSSGNVVTVGIALDSSNTFGSYTILDSINQEQMLAVKTDNAGNIIWAIGSQGGKSSGNSVAIDPAGNAYILGQNLSSPVRIGSFSLSSGTYMVKVSPSGTVLWARNILTMCTSERVHIDRAGYFYIAGYYYGSVTLGSTTLTSSGGMDLFIAKCDTALNPIWATSIGSAGNDYLNGTAIDNNNNFYASCTYNDAHITVGSSSLSTTYYDTFLHQYQGSFLVKLDSAGSISWATTTDHHSYVGGLAADDNGNLYTTGSIDSVAIFDTITSSWAANSDIFINAYGPTGRIKWLRTVGGVNNESGMDISVGACGKIISCGRIPCGLHTFYSLTFGSITVPAPVTRGDASYCAVYDSLGNCDTAVTLLSGSDDYLGIHADQHGSFYVAGDFAYNSFTLGADTLTLSGPMGEYLMVARFTYDTAGCPPASTLGVEPAAMQAGINLYPNPANETITIASDAQITEVLITDAMGRAVYSAPTLHQTHELEVNIARLPAGIYLARINGSTVRKFIKE